MGRPIYDEETKGGRNKENKMLCHFVSSFLRMKFRFWGIAMVGAHSRVRPRMGRHGGLPLRGWGGGGRREDDRRDERLQCHHDYWENGEDNGAIVEASLWEIGPGAMATPGKIVVVVAVEPLTVFQGKELHVAAVATANPGAI